MEGKIVMFFEVRRTLLFYKSSCISIKWKTVPSFKIFFKMFDFTRGLLKDSKVRSQFLVNFANFYQYLY